MLIKLVEWLGKNKNLNRIHKGTVINNIDPDKLGRLKIEIPGLLEGLSTNNLPWIYPINYYGIGGGSLLSGFSVPEIDSELLIEFPYDDIYFGFYTGYRQSKVTHQDVFDADYPETYGWRDSTGLILKINKSIQKLEFEHPSGVIGTIDKDGNVDLNVTKNANISISGDFTTAITGDDTKTIAGDKTLVVSGNELKIINANSTKSITGNAITNVVGNEVKTVIGTSTTNITGVVTVAVAGTVNLSVIGLINILSLGPVAITGLGISLNGGGVPAGVITAASVCPFTGNPHTDPSVTVLASK
jgi:hypothetical protein